MSWPSLIQLFQTVSQRWNWILHGTSQAFIRSSRRDIHLLPGRRKGKRDNMRLEVLSIDTMFWALVNEDSRFLTSAYILANPSHFEAFVEDGQSLDSWCAREVDAWGTEAGELQVLGLCGALQSNVEIAYLDRSSGDSVTTHQFAPPTSYDNCPVATFTPTLLYRPGHYDILYKAGAEVPSWIA